MVLNSHPNVEESAVIGIKVEFRSSLPKSTLGKVKKAALRTEISS